MATITYAFVDENGNRGSRVALNNDNNTWDFAPDGGAKSVGEWFNRNKKDIAIGIFSSIISSLAVYAILKHKGMIKKMMEGGV